MLSATFFRSKFDSLFYMIRMLRSPLPRTMEYLPALIHEHIVCEVPETGRTWQASTTTTNCIGSNATVIDSEYYHRFYMSYSLSLATAIAMGTSPSLISRLTIGHQQDDHS